MNYRNILVGIIKKLDLTRIYYRIKILAAKSRSIETRIKTILKESIVLF